MRFYFLKEKWYRFIPFIRYFIRPIIYRKCRIDDIKLNHDKLEVTFTIKGISNAN
jgi:hypothetical protein